MAPHTVKYALPGTKPPVYLAGSFSHPEWQPQEMQYTHHQGSDEYEFYKEVDIEEGRDYQYKFRLGPGDWWILNESSPVVTDDAGNRNNLLAIPKSKPNPQEPKESTELAEGKMEHNNDGASSPNTKENDTLTTSSSPPVLIVEKVDSKPSFGDDFGAEATSAQKIAHSQRSEDSEPDYVVVRGDHTPSSTPDTEAETAAEVAESAAILDRDQPSPAIPDTEAETAAEVAESAAILDRDQPSPAIPDDEAGRIGLRRMSNTPIQQVANTAAEVADVAATLDQEPETFSPKLDRTQWKMEMPQQPQEDEIIEETASGAATPWEDRVPLFSHECVTRPEREDQPESREHMKYDPSSSHSPFVEAIVDPNDPNIEDFPIDRASILQRLQETQRRMAEDETHFEGPPKSPVIDGYDHSERLDLPSTSPNMLGRSDERSGSLDSIQEVEDHDHPDEVLASLPESAVTSKNQGVFASNEARKPSVDVQEVSDPESPPAPRSIDAPSSIEMPSKPTDATHEITPKTDAGPSIVVSPATPGLAQLKEPITAPKEPPVVEEENSQNVLKHRKQVSEESTTTAKSSAVEVEVERNSRKQVSPVQDRAPTPTSMSKEKSKNFFTNFLRLFFVEWIGGFFSKLCGGRGNA